MARSSTSWAAGQSGNPSGRPKKGLSLTDALRKQLSRNDPSGKRNVDAIAEKIIELCRAGDKEMISLVWDRLDGRVPAVAEVSGEMTINHVELDADARAAIEEAERILAERGGDAGV